MILAPVPTRDHETYLMITQILGWSGQEGGQRNVRIGESVEIHPANVALRAVFVPAGRHRVTFTYRPIGTYFGLALGLLGLLAWIAVEVRELVRKRRAVAPAPAAAIR